MPRRLTRDTKRAVLGGVASGIADYCDLDPVLFRLGFVLLCFVNGTGLIAYLICWVLIPAREPEPGEAQPAEQPAGQRIVDGVREAGEKAAEGVRRAGEKVVDGLRGTGEKNRRGNFVVGGILIVVGIAFLIDELPWLYWPQWARFSTLWPLLLVAFGIALILGARRSKGA